MRIRLLIPLFLISSVNLFGQWHLSSPNGELKLTANLSASNELFYKIDYNNNGTVTSIIQDSYLGLLRND
jgi:hypothetical protein